MEYNLLLDLATDLGYELAMSGAETFRVEESITRVLASYGIDSEVFAIPNYLIVSIIADDGQPITRMRRIGYHGNDLDAVEKLNALSRALCNRTPEPAEAIKWLEITRSKFSHYRLPIYLLGDFLGAAGFAILFGCRWIEILYSGICAIAAGFLVKCMDSLKVNPFFTTIAAAFISSVIAYGLNAAGIAHNVDGIVIGALMILVPGLLFTNAMRDIIYGDINSGVNRIVQVLIIAVAIALGTAFAWNVTGYLWRSPVSSMNVIHPIWIECLAAGAGCIGFAILFNIHGPGGLLCALGGLITWGIYAVSLRATGNDIYAYFFGALFGSLYAEVMARIRKYPAISYLVVSLFPLIPGAGVYYTMNHALHGEMELFAAQGMHTAAIAGVMAVGILLVSTVVRMYYTWKGSHT